MVKKLDLLLEAMQAEDWKKALSIAAKFPRLGEEKTIIIVAHEAFEYPDFYKQIRKNPDELIKLGIEALKHKYGKKLFNNVKH